MLAIVIEIVWLGLLMLALWAPGYVLGRALGSRCPALAREAPAAIALGMGIWCVFLFVLAAVGALWPRLVSVVFWASVAAGAWCLGSELRRWRVPRESGAARSSSTAWWLLAPLAAAAAVIVLALASYPSIGWDDAVYHLRLPALYLKHHGFVSPRFSFFSHWPQNLELLFALAMAVRGFVLAKLLHAACGVLAAIATYRLARTASSPSAALAAAALVAATPLVLEAARVAYVDLAVMLFVVLAVGALLRAAAGERVRSHLALAGIFLGMATGTKLTAWLAVAALGAVWSVAALRRAERGVAGDLVALVAPAILLAAPWHLKAMVATGNPVYPLLYGVFEGPDWSSELARRAGEWQRGIGMGRGVLDYLALPWRVFARGAKGYERFDGALGWYWLPVVGFALAAGWRDRRARLCIAIGAVYFLLWAAGPQQARFLLPVLPLFAVAAAVAAGRLDARFEAPRAVPLFAAFAGLVLLLNLMGPFRDAGRQLEARRRFGSELEQSLVPPAWRYLEESTPSSATVLFVNNNRVFPLDREAFADSAFEASQIAAWLAPATSPAAVAEILRGEGVTHVLLERIDWGIDWSPAVLELLADPSRSSLVFESPDRRFAVYELARP